MTEDQKKELLARIELFSIQESRFKNLENTLRYLESDKVKHFCFSTGSDFQLQLYSSVKSLEELSLVPFLSKEDGLVDEIHKAIKQVIQSRIDDAKSKMEKA